ncbi:MAG: glutamyl-tRNA reductase [Chloroherpetonaceae bacterium]|nr:glutamyl-tRNA reductase [Chthonomonadaceae bacterium]MDW8209010.1 glutamyl-tRNA reductase [Chloroherpetonaceae bacterium]
MYLALFGVSHHQAPIEVRERLSFPERYLPEALRALADVSDVREGVILSTCNRTEVYAVVETQVREAACGLLQEYLARFHQIAVAQFAPYGYCKLEQEVVYHLLRVAAGLDSLVLGETQILGQVRRAFRITQESGTVGSVLTTLLQWALLTGKRVQTETGLGRGAFSIGHAAVDLARSIFDDLSQATVLVIGAGKMSELTARHLMDNGVRIVLVANRTYEKAMELARRFQGRAVRYDTLAEELVTADIVLSSTAAPHPVLRRETVQAALRKRKGRPLFLIDIAVPRDIEPSVGELDNVFLYNIDDLQAVVLEAARGRMAEIARAEAIVAEEAARFLAWYRSRAVAPVIAQMRARLEQIRQGDLQILRTRLSHLSEADWAAVEAATRAMMNRISRTAIRRLKQETEACAASAPVPQYDLSTAARELFGLQTEATAADTVSAPTDGTPAADVVGLDPFPEENSAIEVKL